MKTSSTVTCSFTMDRKTYNEYKSIVSRNGENVKENIINYMKKVILYETPNAKTIEAIEEIQYMKKHPESSKSFTNVDEMFKELLS